jgi:diguanylate cyclase (GGDEF)-like protein
MKPLRSLADRLTLSFALVACVLVTILMLTLLSAFGRFNQFTTESGQRHLSEVLKTQLEQDAALLTDTLSAQLDIPLYHLDLTEIGKQLRQVQAQPGLDYVLLFDHELKLVHDGSEAVADYGRPLESIDQVPGDAEQAWVDSTLHLFKPIQVSNQTIGQLALAVDFTRALENLTAHSNAISAEAAQKQRQLAGQLVMGSVILLLLALLFTWLFCRRLFRPLRQLADKSLRYGEGDKSVNFGMTQQDELGQLGNALEQMRRNLEQSHRQTNQLAYLDNLTQLPNRHWFQQSLERLLQYSERNGQRLGVVFIDLDHFKEVNDTAGHDMGDLLLFEAAARLRNLLLELDVCDPETGEVLLARLGGDEFVTLYPAPERSDQVAELAGKVAATLDQPFLIDGRYFNISSSIGITLYPDDGASSSEILKNADIAMYAAKQSGRNQYAFFSPQMNQELYERLEILQGVRTALAESQFHLEYQPVIDLRNGRIRAAEALLRWNHPEQGLISPARFIPLIEDSDLMEPVTRWVAHQAIHDLLELQALYPGFAISINISGAALHQASTRTFLTELIQARGVPPHCLSIELTETSMIRHLDDCRDTLTQWKDAGINIWIDDFGTGYSSLSYLHQLPIDGLKIDRSFIRELRPESDHSLVESIVTLARSMKLKTVAEGIETDSQLACITALGSHYGQGFGLYRPMRYSSLKPLLEQQCTETSS